MTQPRLIATDLDGTLLRNDGSLSERTRKALDLATAGGAEVVLVTARPPPVRGRPGRGPPGDRNSRLQQRGPGL
ncbi:HAD family hydrolase [Streptomyces sp. NPDC017520]|uniref:HAD family hydrolase n=1 Tax=Streptomyces sp. NPDC017520 TaxID=3364998 RepID=UPI0037A5680B